MYTKDADSSLGKENKEDDNESERNHERGSWRTGVQQSRFGQLERYSNGDEREPYNQDLQAHKASSTERKRNEPSSPPHDPK